MIEIYDFENVPVSDRNGTSSRAAGSKEGVLIDDEYIGSYVYEMLGYDVQRDGISFGA